MEAHHHEHLRVRRPRREPASEALRLRRVEPDDTTGGPLDRGAFAFALVSVLRTLAATARPCSSPWTTSSGSTPPQPQPSRSQRDVSESTRSRGSSRGGRPATSAPGVWQRAEGARLLADDAARGRARFLALRLRRRRRPRGRPARESAVDSRADRRCPSSVRVPTAPDGGFIARRQPRSRPLVCVPLASDEELAAVRLCDRPNARHVRLLV